MERKRYIAVVTSDAIRDMRVCKDNKRSPLESTWYDAKLDAYLGIFEGSNARATAANYAGTAEENIRLIEL